MKKTHKAVENKSEENFTAFGASVCTIFISSMIGKYCPIPLLYNKQYIEQRF